MVDAVEDMLLLLKEKNVKLNVMPAIRFTYRGDERIYQALLAYHPFPITIHSRTSERMLRHFVRSGGGPHRFTDFLSRTTISEQTPLRQAEILGIAMRNESIFSAVLREPWVQLGLIESMSASHEGVGLPESTWMMLFRFPGLDMNAQCPDFQGLRNTPFTHRLARDHVEIVMILLRHPDLDLSRKAHWSSHQNPLLAASQRFPHNEELVRQMLSRGASLEPSRHHHLSPCHRELVSSHH